MTLLNGICVRIPFFVLNVQLHYRWCSKRALEWISRRNTVNCICNISVTQIPALWLSILHGFRTNLPWNLTILLGTETNNAIKYFFALGTTCMKYLRFQDRKMNHHDLMGFLSSFIPFFSFHLFWTSCENSQKMGKTRPASNKNAIWIQKLIYTNTNWPNISYIGAVAEYDRHPAIGSRRPLDSIWCHSSINELIFKHNLSTNSYELRNVYWQLDTRSCLFCKFNSLNCSCELKDQKHGEYVRKCLRLTLASRHLCSLIPSIFNWHRCYHIFVSI